MAISAVQHGTLEALAEHLSNAILAHRKAERDPFLKPRIFVPNLQLEKWLRLRLAGTGTKVAVHLQAEYIESGLWNLLAECDRERRKDEPGVEAVPGETPVATRLVREPLLMMIYAVLNDRSAMLPDCGDLRHLQDYIHADDGPTGQIRRQWQLADYIARLFRDYEMWQPELVKAWKAGRFDEKAPQNQCQGRIYHALFATGGLRDRIREKTGREYISLPEYARQLLGSKRFDASKLADKLPLYLFTLPDPAPEMETILRTLSEHRDLVIYELDWSGIKNSGDDLREQWGKLAEKRQKMLQRLSGAILPDCATNAIVPDCSNTLLFRLQRHLLGEADLPDGLVQDTSLQVAGCPSVRHEVETVYNSIAQNVIDGWPDVELTDIAVLVPDMATYKPAIEAVFGRIPRLLKRPLPYNLLDSSAAEDSAYAQAALALLNIGEEGFTRREVFDLVGNPCFQARFGMDRADADLWLSWADKLNICRGGEDDISPGLEVYSWLHAFKRMRMGRVMDCSDPERGLLAGDQCVVPFADMQSASAAADLLFETLESLIEWRSELREPRTLEQWSASLEKYFDTFLDVPADRKEEQPVRSALRRTLAALKNDEQILAIYDRNGQCPKLSLEVVRQLVQDGLIELSSRTGSYLLGGVTISALRPGRPVPFKIVYVLGLGEGCYPPADSRTILDLGRGTGLTQGQLGRHAMLETVLSARNKLYLTYVNQDLQKAEKFEPCSIVNELRSFLAPKMAVKKGGESQFKIQHIPLKSWHARCLPPAQKPLTTDPSPLTTHPSPPWTDLPAQSFFLNDRLLALQDLKARGKQPPAPFEVVAQNVQRDMRLWVTGPSVPSEPLTAAAPTEIVEVSLKQLAGFLEDPIQAICQYHLHFSKFGDEEDDAAMAEDIPSQTQFFRQRTICSDAVRRVLETPAKDLNTPSAVFQAMKEGTLQELHQQAYWRAETPPGGFKAYEYEKIAEQIQVSMGLMDGLDTELLTACKTLKKDSLTAVVLGPAFVQHKTVQTFDELLLDASIPGNPKRDIKLKISGSCDLIATDADGNRHAFIVCMAKHRDGLKLTPHVCAPFLLMMAAAAGGNGVHPKFSTWWGGGTFSIHVIYRDKSLRCRYSVPEPSVAQEYLRRLALALIAPQWDALEDVPFKAVAAIKPELMPGGKNFDEQTFLATLRGNIERDADGFGQKSKPPRFMEFVKRNTTTKAIEMIKQHLTEILKGEVKA
ncbi:MAG TPA: exodeoxyribonuclease V subunit gamma [Planctomycetota bacterium]|jgi:exodeoxyribonuclease V gamma subunit